MLGVHTIAGYDPPFAVDHFPCVILPSPFDVHQSPFAIDREFATAQYLAKGIGSTQTFSSKIICIVLGHSKLYFYEVGTSGNRGIVSSHAYRCKKCQRVVALQENHKHPLGGIRGKVATRSTSVTRLSAHPSIFVEPLCWMTTG
ncbi:unnamed protein product [Camellia sinensis]